MRRLVLAAPLLVAACAVDPNAPGIVSSFNGESVELTGALPMDGNFTSTPGLDASARKVCPNAEWVGWRDSGNNYSVVHIYRCQ